MYAHATIKIRWPMYSLTKNKIKNFLVVLLALLMAITMAFATACTTNDDGDDGDGGNSETTTETTLTDYQVLKNGDFEFMTDDETVYPKSSSIAWSNSLDSGLNGNTAPSTSTNRLIQPTNSLLLRFS